MTTVSRPETPEHGYHDDTDVLKNHRLETMTAFCSAYAKYGTVTHAAVVANVSRESIYQWDRNDVDGFRDKFEAARHEYRDEAERLMDERLANPQGNRGSDILLMFKLKALYPDKYRENIIIADDSAKDLLSQLRKGSKVRAQADTQCDAGDDVKEDQPRRG